MNPQVNASTDGQMIPFTVGKYQVIRQIGKGGFATVVLAVDPKTNQNVAIKIFDRQFIVKGGYMKYLENELRLCSRLNHPNIVKILDVVYDERSIMIVMEYLSNGDLQSLIMNGYHFSIPEQIRISLEILQWLNYLHKRGISHRDIKPENIMFDQNFHAKIIDFGFSKESSMMLKTYCGTPFYMSPEVIQTDCYDGIKSDIWAFGITIHVIAVKLYPFECHNEIEFMKLMQHNKLRISIIPKGIIGDICEKSLKMDPNSRSSAEQLIEMLENYLATSTILNNSGVHQLKQETLLPSLPVRKHSPSSVRVKILNSRVFKKTKFNINVKVRVINKSTPNL